MSYKIMILVVAAVLVTSGSAWTIDSRGDQPQDASMTMAQADSSRPQMDRPMSQGRPGMGGEFGQGPRKFERLRLKKLIELLELQGEKKDAFVKVSEKFRDRRMEFMRAHMATVDSLADGIRTGTIDEKGIQRLVGRLDEMEGLQAKTRKEFRDEVKPLLDAEQYGKLVVFEYRFEAQVMDRLSDFRKHRGGPPPGMPRPMENMDNFLDNDSI